MSPRRLTKLPSACLPLLACLALTCGPAAAAAPAAGDLLVVGPLPIPGSPAVEGPLAPEIETITELDPRTASPVAGYGLPLAGGSALKWREAPPLPMRLEGPGIWWISGRVAVERFTRLTVELTAPGDVRAWLGGDEVELTAGRGEKKDDVLVGSRQLRRGIRSLLLRVEAGPDQRGEFSITAAADPEIDIDWSARDDGGLADYERLREISQYSDLLLSEDGALLARRIRTREAEGEGSRTRLDILDANGVPVAASLGGADARGLDFAPTGELLFAARRDEGEDLMLWKAGALPRRLIAGEPGVAWARFSPGGASLLLASSRGAKAPRRDEGPSRKRALREGLPDYRTAAHLHLVDVRSGARRRLTLPGDSVLDDACFVKETQVVYARTVPRGDRPWFATEFRRIDLATGEDRPITEFSAGWEYRPRGFAAEPGGRRLALLGPPEELGEGHAEHNVFNAQVWLLDLEEGSMRRLTPENGPSFDVRGASRLAWAGPGRLTGVAMDGSRTALVRLTERDGQWDLTKTPLPVDVARAAAFSGDASVLAVAVSGRDSLPALHRVAVDAMTSVAIESPNAGIENRWRLSHPREADFTGPGGERIDGWYYPPVFAFEPRKIPLIVYYYGGAVATSRAFNPLHQHLAANGYGVLVLNTRGAAGWGDAFADHHAGDWGPKSAADILAGLDAFLDGHPEINRAAIGIYGGSYGGFMTEYLLTRTDRFAAAVSLYGISSLSSYWGLGAWGWTYGDMSVAGARPWADRGLFVDHSPLFNAERIRTPLLLLHGAADGNVPPGESGQLYTALKILGREVELVSFPGEDHGISGTFSNHLLHRQLLLDWFDRFLRDQPEAWESHEDL